MVGFNEILVIIIVAVIVLFGASQIPKIARSIGEGIRELKKGIKDEKDPENDDNEEKEKVKTPKNNVKKASKK